MRRLWILLNTWMMTYWPRIAEVMIAVYTVSFGVISVMRYWTYQNFYYDLGIFDDALWHLSRFEAPIVDKGFNGEVIFADHFNPILILLSPIYWFTDKVEAYLLLQALAVGVSAWFAFLVVQKLVREVWIRLALMVSYLGFVGLQNALITDFHPATVVVLPVMAWFWMVFTQRWRWVWVLTLLILMFKENMAGLVIGLGMFVGIYWRRLYWKESVLLVFIGMVWGLLALKVVIPAFNYGGYVYSPKNVNVESLVMGLTDVESKRETLWYSLATFGFLPVLEVALWPVLYEHFVERFVLTDAATRWDLGFHYNAMLSPLYLVASALVIKRWQSIIGRPWLIFGSMCLMMWVGYYHQFVYHGPFNLVFNPGFYAQLPNVKYQDDFVAMFPQKGVVMTQNDLAVRLTHGPEVRLLRKYYWLIDPDYVILNLTDGQNPNSYFPLTRDEVVQIKDDLLLNPTYELRKMHDEQYMFVKIRDEISS